MKARIWYKHNIEKGWWHGFIGFKWPEQTAKLVWVLAVPTMPSKESVKFLALQFGERFGIEEWEEVGDPQDICLGFAGNIGDKK